MEGMNLAKLEAVVDKLLNSMQDLKRENATLQAQLESRNEKIAELEGRLGSMTANQEEVSNRVTNLLSSIEEWEKSADFDGGVDEEEVVTPREASLFSIAD